MSNPEFIYTTYIKTTPEKLWKAITNPEFTRQYWGSDNVSDWKKGSKWSHVVNDEKRTVRIVGEVLESLPPKRLVLTWAAPANVEDKSEHSRVTFEIEPVEDMVRLNVIHDKLKAGSEMARAISGGWPRVLSSLKSLFETGMA
ncbi:MAG: activator of Hsp90 ATPase 1 family protein, partial [Bacteriovoracaceae bacterium]|nr:activator of Hsp90 ATPase 1 family protein [Bacteriovoracaceae bacterium]